MADLNAIKELLSLGSASTDEVFASKSDKERKSLYQDYQKVGLTSPNKGGFWSNLGASTYTGLMGTVEGMGATLTEVTGWSGMEDAMKDWRARNRHLEPWWGYEGASDFSLAGLGATIGRGVGQSARSMAVGFGTGLLTGNPVAGTIAGTADMVSWMYGNKVREYRELMPNQDESTIKMLAFGECVGEALIENCIGPEQLATQLGAKFGKGAAMQAGKEIIRQGVLAASTDMVKRHGVKGLAKALATIGWEGAKAGSIEGSEELTQQWWDRLVESIGTGNLRVPTWSEMRDEFVGGALPGAFLGGGGNVLSQASDRFVESRAQQREQRHRDAVAGAVQEIGKMTGATMHLATQEEIDARYEEVAKAKGTTVEALKKAGTEIDGWHKGSDFWVNPNVESEYFEDALGHEMHHFLKENHGEVMQHFSDVVAKLVERSPAAQQEIERLTGQYENVGDANVEFECNLASRLLRSPEFFESFVSRLNQQEEGLGTRFAEAVLDFVEQVINFFKGSPNYEQYKGLVDHMELLSRLYGKSVSEAAAETRGAAAQAEAVATPQADAGIAAEATETPAPVAQPKAIAPVEEEATVPETPPAPEQPEVPEAMTQESANTAENAQNRVEQPTSTTPAPANESAAQGTAEAAVATSQAKVVEPVEAKTNAAPAASQAESTSNQVATTPANAEAQAGARQEVKTPPAPEQKTEAGERSKHAGEKVAVNDVFDKLTDPNVTGMNLVAEKAAGKGIGIRKVRAAAVELRIPNKLHGGKNSVFTFEAMRGWQSTRSPSGYHAYLFTLPNGKSQLRAALDLIEQNYGLARYSKEAQTEAKQKIAPESSQSAKNNVNLMLRRNEAAKQDEAPYFDPKSKAAVPTRPSPERMRQITHEKVKTAGDGTMSNFCLRSGFRAAGVEVEEKDGVATLWIDRKKGLKVTKDTNIEQFATRMLREDTPLSATLRMAVQYGTIDKATAMNFARSMAHVLRAAASVGDIDGGIEIANAVWRWAGNEEFKALKQNADSQYKTSIDMLSICKKTEQLIMAASEFMIKNERAVMPTDLMDLYDQVGKAKFQTPCPICYVFAHWIQAGYTRQTAWDAQRTFAKYLNDPQYDPRTAKGRDFWRGKIAEYEDWAAVHEDEIDEAKDLLRIGGQELDSRWINDHVVDTGLAEKMAKAYQTIRRADYANWIKQNIYNPGGGKQKAKVHTDFKMVPAEVVFDFRQAATIVREYPALQRFMKSKGSAAGKSIQTEAENDFGDVIAGIAADGKETAVNQLKVAFDAKARGDMKGYQTAMKEYDTQFKRALGKAARQRLIGGQRFFSWSDNRVELGMDMMMNLMQVQLLGNAVQAYSKQLEGVELLAVHGASVNGSLLAKGIGYKFVEKGTPDAVQLKDGRWVQLLFSDIQGINAKELFKLNDKYDRAGNILVGMDDIHIQALLRDKRIFFGIPYHASSLSQDLLEHMTKAIGEKMEKGRYDYTKLQNELWISSGLHGSAELAKKWDGFQRRAEELGFGGGVKVEHSADGELTDSQREYRALRERLLLGNYTAADMALIKSDPFLSQVAAELRQAGSRVRAAGGNYVTKDGLLKMTGNEAAAIYPYEYWDKASTYETSAVNSARYLEYCRRLGVAPKFSGFQKLVKKGQPTRIERATMSQDDGKTYFEFGDFTDEDNYWKLLIDRRMYDRAGRYQDTDQITAATSDREFDVDTILPNTVEQNWTRNGKTLISRNADPTAVPAIVEKTELAQKARGQIQPDMKTPVPDFKDEDLVKLRADKAKMDAEAEAKKQERAAKKAAKQNGPSFMLRMRQQVNQNYTQEFQDSLNDNPYTVRGQDTLRREAAKAIADLGGIESAITAAVDGKVDWDSDTMKKAGQFIIQSPEFFTRPLADRMKVYKAFQESSTRAGQTLAALRRDFDPRSHESVRNTVARLLAHAQARDPRTDLVKRLQEKGIDPGNLPDLSKDPVALDNELRAIKAALATKTDKFFEYWMNGILSAITTHGGNTIGNVGNMLYELGPKRMAEAAVNLFARNPEGATFGEMRRMWSAFDWRQAWKAAQFSFQNEIVGEDGKFDLESGGPAIGGKLGRAIRVPSRFLRAADAFIKALVRPMEATAWAYREASRRGLSGQAREDYIAAELQDEKSAANKYGHQRALELTFQEDPGALVNGLIRLRENSLAAKFLFPFIKTPYNLLRQGIRKGPLGMLNLSKELIDVARHKRGFDNEVIAHMAEQIVFWGGVMALAALLGGGDDDEPWITGNPGKMGSGERMFKNRNLPAYSIRIGGTWYSYRRIEPFSTALASLADAMEAYRTADSGEKLTSAGKAMIKGAGNIMVEKSYLNTFNQLIQIAEDPERKVRDWGTDFVASWVPNIYRQTINAIQPNQPDYKNHDKDVNFFEDFFKTSMSKAGFTSRTPKLDYFGREIPKDVGEGAPAALWRFLVPIQRKRAGEGDDIDTLLWNYNMANPKEPYWPSLPQLNMKADGSRYDFSGVYEDFVRDSGELAHTMMEAAVRQGRLNVEEPTDEDIKLIKRLFSQARKQVRLDYVRQGLVEPEADED